MRQQTIRLPIECTNCGYVGMIDQGELWRGCSARCMSCGVTRDYWHGIPVPQPRRHRPAQPGWREVRRTAA